MQVRLSWQFIAAALIFLIALCLLGRSVVALVRGPSAAAQPTAPAASAPLESPAAPSAAAQSDTPTLPTATPGATAAASPTAAPTIEPSATAEPSAAPSATPQATLTPTVAATAIVVPTVTPAPERLQLVNAGFAQPEQTLVYAFTAVNPNQAVMVRDTRYQLVVYDAEGIVIKTDAGSVGPVNPGEQIGLVAFIDMPDGLRGARVDVILGGGTFLLPPNTLPITSENLGYVPGEKPLVTGLVANPYSKDLQDLPVAAILYNAEGAIIGGGTATIPFIPAGDRAAAEIPVLAGGDPVRVELYPRLDSPPAP